MSNIPGVLPLAQDFQGYLEKLNNKLEQLIQESEDYYSVIHESLPVIERNIELTQQETSLLITYFVETAQEEQAAAEKEKYLISQSLGQIKKNFLEISGYLLNKKEIEKILEIFLKDDNQDNSFSAFVKLVEETKTTLTDVGDISLNAIIFSSHLGSEGMGFRVISDHIHQISTVLHEEMTRIDGLVSALVDWHGHFQGNIESIVTQQEKALEEYIQQLDRVFSLIVNSIQEITSILKNMMDNVSESISPFQELMVLIQRQDIVRQNTENTLKCIGIIQEEFGGYLELLEGGGSREQLLDRATFNSRAMGLVNKLNANMTDSLEGSVEEIHECSQSLIDALGEVYEDSGSLIGFLVGEKSLSQRLSNNNDMSAVDFTFQSLFSFMNDFLKTLIDIRDLVSQLSLEKQQFDQSIGQTKASMEKVQQRVGMLNRIKILVRIELARMKEQDSAIGRKIEDVVEDVNQTLSENQKVFSNLKNELEKNLEQFERLILGNQSRIGRAVNDVQDSLDKLNTTNKIINQAIQALSKEIEVLNTEVNKVFLRIQDSGKIKGLIQEINALIQEAIENSTRQGEMVMGHFQVDKWEEKNQDLVKMFDLFTSYLERSAAKDYLEDQTLDEGTDEGELTLF